jgi:hypothetical protein
MTSSLGKLTGRDARLVPDGDTPMAEVVRVVVRHLRRLARPRHRLVGSRFREPFLPASMQALRVFRLLRVLRLIAVVGYARRLFSLNGLAYGALLALITVLGGGAAFAHAEGKEVSTWDGMWWAVTTMTTVGYGDLYPHTDLGRGIAIVVMVVGIGFLSLLIGAVSERFLASELRQEAEQVERGSKGTSNRPGLNCWLSSVQ